ncbi:NUDIX domain-containing protein [Adhaeribacter pallidiroseus]|uniref:8-oxo-dGTP diphosphatase n=1 Tax=Adhaeribacter pallidiroseus TaxID=2072847 RepID=A0A369QH64_9BACT|nr:NUDIX hydrolase [Adhaeribacter pallidiroseus]RDC62607.1 8-oxo-dGTP diphosphatase [Adhaeribacter pallidiroseus]
MHTSSAELHYSGKLRVRVCGVCQQANQLLLIRHKPFAQNKSGLWSMPGGGLHYGETLELGLEREFKEETGLQVKVGSFLFVHEFISLPLHALELFFAVTITGGELTTGFDPELEPHNQLIAEVAFKSLPDIQELPPDQLHQVLQGLHSLDDLYRKGFSSCIP